MKEEHKQEAGSPAYQGTKVESVCDATSMTTLAIDQQTRVHTVTDIALLTNHIPLTHSRLLCPAASNPGKTRHNTIAVHARACGACCRHARAQAGSCQWNARQSLLRRSCAFMAASRRHALWQEMRAPDDLCSQAATRNCECEQTYKRPQALDCARVIPTTTPSTLPSSRLHGMRDAASGRSATLPPAALAAARPRELGACRCPPRARRPRMYRFCVCAGMGVSDVAAGGIRCSCG